MPNRIAATTLTEAAVLTEEMLRDTLQTWKAAKRVEPVILIHPRDWAQWQKWRRK